jgi:hypothetical protein
MIRLTGLLLGCLMFAASLATSSQLDRIGLVADETQVERRTCALVSGHCMDSTVQARQVLLHNGSSADLAKRYPDERTVPGDRFERPRPKPPKTTSSRAT